MSSSAGSAEKNHPVTLYKPPKTPPKFSTAITAQAHSVLEKPTNYCSSVFSNFLRLLMANSNGGRRQQQQGQQGYPPGFSQLWWAAFIGSLALNVLAGWFAVPSIKNRSRQPPPVQACSAPEPAVASAIQRKDENKKEEKKMERVDEISVSATSGSRPNSIDAFINLDHGDPTMYETFWQRQGDKGTVTIPGWQKMSYFSDPTNLCWFLEPEFGAQIRRLHKLVGNAVTEDRYIIVGTGSTQLFQAALYSLVPPEVPEPVSVVSAVPYYSSYPAVTDFMKSGLYKWAGNARTFKGDNYIEVICTPNNPDGSLQKAVLSSSRGNAIHDLAYYWPQYTPITEPADHEIMLFTVSKSTGHAGTRIGWALVKNRDIAQRMMKFIELATIGVSKDSQLRAAKILQVVSDVYENPGTEGGDRLFEFGRCMMRDRWERLREVISKSNLFSLPEFPSAFCNFTEETATTYPAFAWLKCEREDIEDCASFLRSHCILVRSGVHSGVEANYVRVSMLDRDDTFNIFLERLSSIQLRFLQD